MSVAEVIFSEDLAKLLEVLETDPQTNQHGQFVYRRKVIMDHLTRLNMTWSNIQTIATDESLVGRPAQGFYDFGKLIKKFEGHLSEKKKTQILEQDEKLKNAMSEIDHSDLDSKDTEYVPNIDHTYVPWGNTKDVLAVVASPRWFPVYIVGGTGGGKTVMVEQCCAQSGREFFRAQIHEDTDEDDLIGGYRLKNGSTVFEDGPVITAMRRGGLLFLDEIDRGSNKLMCLQGILEGKPFLIKKTGEVVHPERGFNVIAAANTKGKGDLDGRYMAATVLDEAFLERFNITIEQEYPDLAVERRIVRNNMIKNDCLDDEFCEHLVRWSDTIRETYLQGGADDLITTRRLTQIVATFSIFGNRQKAIEYGINRFAEDTRDSFLDTYNAIDPSKYMSEASDEDDTQENPEKKTR